ncbi:hypothetical protein [Pseudomonas sp. UW4]|nr:hypothetical protein [Pseudomonas sp. UW4]
MKINPYLIFNGALRHARRPFWCVVDGQLRKGSVNGLYRSTEMKAQESPA